MADGYFNTLSRSLEAKFPCRVEGWLNFWDISRDELKILFDDGISPAVEWEPAYCTLFQDKGMLTHFKNEECAEEIVSKLPVIRLDDGKEEFDKRWGYETLHSLLENALQHSNCPEPSDGTRDTSYERALGERRGSLPLVTVPVANVEESMDGPSNKIMNFFSKKATKTGLKRTKSNSRIDKILKKQGSSENDVSMINTRIRSSQSHESLFTSPSRTIDLSGNDIEIRPLHSSILGQEHCFQVLTSNGSKFYSCRSTEEREKWIECLRKTMHPTQEQSRRTDNSLKLWILEAKHVQPKKRYFCEIHLDKTLYARTSTKQKGDMLFWGEHFDFHNLPPVETITINLYKEADKKKKKDKNVLLGYINISAKEINSRQLAEKWYPMSTGLVGKTSKDSKMEVPVVRVKARYQAIDILPMDHYSPFIQYVTKDYQTLVDALEPVLSVKAKEDLATTLVKILQKVGGVKEFLTDVVMAEIKHQDNENLTFRGNSVATKAMEAYMKLVAEKYLQDTLGEFIRVLVESPDECEVDPARISNTASLQRHQTNLTMYCEMAWAKIINSFCYFPRELWEVFSNFRQSSRSMGREEMSDNVISACIFLRLLCPAILSPSLFGITQELPGEKASRNLTLIAKTIQNLANFTKFGTKEDYMLFMNDFVEREWVSMKNFLKQISSSECKGDLLEFDGYIDLGKELSILHSLLTEGLSKVNKDSEAKLSQLQSILEKIADAKENPLKPTALQPPTDISNLLNIGMWDTSRSHMADSQDVVKDKELYSDDSARSTYAIRQHLNLCSGNKRTAVDLSMTDDYMLYAALDSAGPGYVQSASSRPSEQQVNKTWNKMVSAAEIVNGDYVDLISFMDEDSRDSIHNDGSQISIGQLSNVASSGYQSFGYSQSSSPVDLGVHQDSNHDLRRSPVGLQTMQPLSFSNPMFQHQDASSNRQRRGSGTSSSSVSDEMSTSSQHNTSIDEMERYDKQGRVSNDKLQNGGSSHIRKLSADKGLRLALDDRQRKISPESSIGCVSTTGKMSMDSNNDGNNRKISIDNTGRKISIDSNGRKISIDNSNNGGKISVGGTSGPRVEVTVTRSVPERKDSHDVMLRYAQANSRGDQDFRPHSQQSSRGNSQNSSPHTVLGEQDFCHANRTSSPRNLRECNVQNSSPVSMVAATPHGMSLSESAPSLNYRSSIHRPIPDYTFPLDYETPSSSTPAINHATSPNYEGNYSMSSPRYTTSISMQAISTPYPDDMVGTSTPRTQSVDNFLSRSPDSHSYLSSPDPICQRRASLPPNVVRMGMRSVQMKLHEQDKTKETERELERVHYQLQDTQQKLCDTEQELQAHKETTERIIEEWRQKLHESDRELKKQQYEKECQERQLKDIIQRLVSVEEEMRKEQVEMQKIVQQKSKILESQDRRIQSLDSANARLLSALSQLRDRYTPPASTKATTYTLSLSENGQYKNSDC